MGFFDYITGPEIASAPFYIVILLTLGFYEPLWLCAAYSVLAALIFLGADLLWNPASAKLIIPYWRAVARLLSFVLISSTVSLLVAERRRLRLSEGALQEKAEELQEKNRAIEATMREFKRVQADLVAKERQAAIAETIYATTTDMERPLVSISVYLEEVLRTLQKTAENQAAPDEIHVLLDEIQPLLEKMAERTRAMDGILKNIRELRKGGGG